MKVLISYFWGFLFAFISIFIISSIRGNNGVSDGVSLLNCAVLALVFTLGAAGITNLIKVDKK